jgi:hypothetical protein
MRYRSGLMKNGPYELIIPPPDYPGKRYRGRYAYEHRVTWWRETGLNPDDFPDTVIHHTDEAKRNNIPTNLEMMTRPGHSSHHARGVTMVDYICESCGAAFQRQKRGKKFRFCSRSCIGFFYFRDMKHIPVKPS